MLVDPKFILGADKTVPLDLSAISNQVSQMSKEFVSLDRERYIEEACKWLHRLAPDDLRARLNAPQFGTSWLVAKPIKALAGDYPAPHRPSSFSVAAADGSFIAPDRHNPVRYYVINTGSVLLTYGTEPDAQLIPRSALFYEEKDLYIPHDYKLLPVEGARLGVKMALMELYALLETAEKVSTQRPIIALRDGSLIFWALQADEEEIRERFLRELVELLQKFQSRGIPLASYVSFPNSRDVTNALRVGVCPDDPVSCDQCSDRKQKRDPTCGPLAQVIDRWVFERELPVGSRSATFESSSPILKQYGEGHWVCFFYLNVGEEIARVEVPRWVAQDAGHLGLIHSLVYDQCVRGYGYPSALKEAHEQAVITTTERRVVEEMVEESLGRHNVFARRSAKDTQKRQRGV